MVVTDKYRYNFSLPRYEPPLLLSVEADFSTVDQLQWFQKNQNLSIYSTVLYCFVILSLHMYMKNMPRFEIRSYIIIWNFFLAAFSFLVILRVLPDVLYDTYHYGYEFVLCDSSWILQCPASGFWGTLFVFSKILEFGDTVFLVLRKRQLTILHLYHHISVALAVFYLVTKQVGPGRLAPLVNGGVHTMMYTYFGVRVLGWKVPKWISIALTSLQILQMLYGITVLLQINHIISQGRECDMLFEDIGLAIFLAVSYTILFGNFFYQSYIKKPKYQVEIKKQD